jgi:hypothetical protein
VVIYHGKLPRYFYNIGTWMFSTAAFKSCGELHEDDEGPDVVVEDPEKVHVVRLPAAVGDIETGLTCRVTRLGDFSPIGLLLEAHYVFFEKMK